MKTELEKAMQHPGIKESPADRITDYLSKGGLFNPELMEHEKVRDLLLACREALSNAETRPATQWTAQTVFDLLGHEYGPDGWQRERRIADAHNAALDKLKAELREQIQGELERQWASAAHVVMHSSSNQWVENMDKHDAELKLKIWREAPDQPDIQEAVIAKLNLVHQHAIEKVVDALLALRDGPQRLTPWALKVIDAAIRDAKTDRASDATLPTE